VSDSAPRRPLRHAVHAARRRVRSRSARLRRWLIRARLDLGDARHGRRDPLLPPRRKNLPSQIAAIGERIVELMVDPGGLQREDDVLDIGCGPGRTAAPLTRYLDPEQGSYEGFDVMPRSIRWCRRAISRRHPSFRFQLADLHNAQYNPAGRQRADRYVFPYPDASFEIAVAVSLFTHLRPFESRRYLEETARVLRDGGRLLGTWFLINEEAEELLSRGLGRRQDVLVGERPPLQLGHDYTDERGNRFSSPHGDTPEFMIAVPERDVRAQHEAAGLRIVEIRLGHWPGREPQAGSLGQDLLVAERV
jgi:SAM-dependent methyltransferase